MATTPPVVQASSAADPVKLPVVPLLIAVVLGVVIATLGVGGIVYLLARSGRLPIQSGAAAKTEPAVTPTTHAMVLEPLLVNLADNGGNAYLRVGLTLRVADAVSKGNEKVKEEKPGDSKSSKDADAAVRDTALAVLGRQSAEDLLAVDGKERLKAELKAAIAEHNSELKVTDLFFTEFLVQR
jgi:flagellar protein FliL